MNNMTEYSLLIDDMVTHIIENDGIDDDMQDAVLGAFELFFNTAQNQQFRDWLAISSLIFAYEMTKCNNNLINKAIDKVKAFIVQDAINRYSTNIAVPIPSPNNSRFNNFIQQNCEGGL